MKSYSFDGGTRTLTWDESNRLKSVTNPDGSLWSYVYDTLNRLVSASETTIGNREFTWDTSGNRTSAKVAGANYAYGVEPGSNRLTTSTAPNYAASYQYDAAGQMLSDGSKTFTWNAAGQLASLTGAQGTTSYAYNGFGQRVRKTTGQKSRFFVYAEDGTSILGEYWQGAPGTPVGNVYEIVYLEGIPVAVMSGGQVYYVQTDQLNTPRIIKNAAGGVVWRWDSDPFGGGLANSNPSGLMQFEFNVRFPGQIYDAESGLHYNNARYYDAITGRYISSDPIGLAGGINTYGYVDGSPVSRSDAEGLDWYRPRDYSQPYAVGREGNPLVPPGGLISRLIEHCVPAGRTFGLIHDARVDQLINEGVPDLKANIPSMPGAYRDAVKQETARSLLNIEKTF